MSNLPKKLALAAALALPGCTEGTHTMEGPLHRHVQEMTDDVRASAKSPLTKKPGASRLEDMGRSGAY